MGSEDDPIADFGSDPASPTVEDLVSKLKTSFFPLEFQYVAQTLKDREEVLKNLHSKAEEEKDLLCSENLKLKYELKQQKLENDAMMKVSDDHEKQIRVLNDDLKDRQNEIDQVRKVIGEYELKIRVLNDDLMKKQNEIDEMRKVIAENERKFRVYEKQSLEFDAAAERNRPPLLSEKDSLGKTEFKLHEIIQIVDDDNNLELNSTHKRRRVSNEITRTYHGESAKISPNTHKIELKYSSRHFNICRDRSCDPFFPNVKSQEKRSGD